MFCIALGPALLRAQEEKSVPVCTSAFHFPRRSLFELRVEHFIGSFLDVEMHFSGSKDAFFTKLHSDFLEFQAKILKNCMCICEIL